MESIEKNYETKIYYKLTGGDLAEEKSASPVRYRRRDKVTRMSTERGRETESEIQRKVTEMQSEKKKKN